MSERKRTNPAERIRVGISTCLLGENVRFDGGHKRDRFITDTLGAYFAWVPVCPEVEVGMGTPRETVRLAKGTDGDRMVAPKSGADWTERMRAYSEKRVETLRSQRLRGYILKKDSPTCGMSRVRRYDANGVPSRDGVGLYARSLLKAYPNLPIEEEGRLNDPALRENFVTRVFTFDRWLSLREGTPQPKDLVNFHTAHKMLLLAHDEAAYRQLGPLVASAGEVADLDALLDAYEALMMRALKAVATRKRHVNVLQHLMGFAKRAIDGRDKDELLQLIEEYRRGWVPLATPLALLQHHLRRASHPWVSAQVYLEPYPRPLALRSTV